MKTGFVGLGHLGRAIAGRLIDCGHDLVVWNRTPGRGEDLVAERVSSPAEVMHQAEIVFVCLFDSAAVAEVLLGQNGLLAGEAEGRIIVDCTTNHFREVAAFYQGCRAEGASYLEAPMLGSVVPASRGALTVLVSGEKEAYERVEKHLNDIGKHIFYLKEPALASKMKLVNNLTLGSFMATLAEAVAIAEEAGINRADVLDILAAGGGSSLVLNAKKAKLLEEVFSTHFSAGLIYKDLHCLQDLAYEMKKPLFTGALTKELYGQVCANGFGEEDFAAIFKLFKLGLRDG